MALCACGCGKETELYTTTDSRIGCVKGQPARFVKGHRMRRKATMEEVIDDIKSVLARTESREFPTGDTRSSTYFSQGMGKFSTYTVYEIFGDWPTALEFIFPDGVERRQHKNIVVATERRKPVKALRTCLGPKCRGEKMFLSRDIDNRLCEDCLRVVDGEDEEDMYGETYQIHIPGRKGVLL